MEYMLLIHSDDSRASEIPEAARGEMLGAYRAYSEALHQAGAMRRAPTPPAATWRRKRSGSAACSSSCCRPNPKRSDCSP